MKRLRQILLTQYIGAIIVAFIAAQGILQVVALAVAPLRWYFEVRNRHTAEVLIPGLSSAQTLPPPPFPWDGMVLTGVNIALYLLVAYLLARWLYKSEMDTTVRSSCVDHEEGSMDTGEGAR